jgi:hypothetical protein
MVIIFTSTCCFKSPVLMSTNIDRLEKNIDFYIDWLVLLLNKPINPNFDNPILIF